MKNVAVDAHSAEFAGILFWRLTVAADARDAVFAGGCSVETVAADAHDAGRGGVSAWFSQCGVCRDTRVGTAAADARDAVFAGVVVWKPLQLMLMMLLVAVFVGIVVWKPLQLMLMMRCLQRGDRCR